MATTPVSSVTPEMADMRIQLGIEGDKAILAIHPDPSPTQYERVRDILPEEDFLSFRYVGTKINFSVIEVAVSGADKIKRVRGVAEEVAGALAHRRSQFTTHIDEKIRALDPTQLIENVFFSKPEEPAPETEKTA